MNSTGRRRYGIALAVAALTWAGCCGMQTGPTQGDLVMDTLEQWRAGIVTADLETIMATHSEAYLSPDNWTKRDMRAYTEQMIADGQLDGVVVDLDKTGILIEGDTARASGITARGPGWSGTFEFTLEREGGRWLITSSDAQMTGP